jgi:myo-inositol 2-dehydrogenase/D-chiro-inositol 1-dehydrogenase
MSVHDIDAMRWMLGATSATRVFAAGTIAVHEGLRECVRPSHQEPKD